MERVGWHQRQARPANPGTLRASWLRSCGGLALLACVAAGCSSTVSATGHVMEPAAVPVRAFPRIWLLEGELPVERSLVRSLAAHLKRSGEATVDVLSREQWADRRARGGIPAATVVVRLHLQVDENLDTRWSQRPDTVCDSLGCYTVQRSYPYEIPTLQARLFVTVYDARSAEQLQRARADLDTQEGYGYDTMKEQAEQELTRRLARMVDQRRRRVEVELLEADGSPVERALASASKGRWSDARERLERFVDSADFEQLDASQRARVLYDLGQMRRFGARSGEDPEQRLQAAKQAFRNAVALDEQARYAAGVKAASRDLRNLDLIRDQRAAARTNFALSAAGEASQGVTPDAGVKHAPR